MTQIKRGKNSSSKNKKTNTKGRTNSTRSKKQVQQTNPEVKGEVLLISFFVLCVLMFLSCFECVGLSEM